MSIKKVQEQIKEIALSYKMNLAAQMQARKEEMLQDDNSHYQIYNVLGISDADGANIDIYQNMGRFLYKYTGALLEDAAIVCIKNRYPDAQKTRVKNNIGTQPATFEIDSLCGTDAIEIKWRDATTDGDHIKKEETRVKVIKSYGYKPIRVMFFVPNRQQAIKIQAKLKTIYEEIGGEYYAGEDAWEFIRQYTGYDLQQIMEGLARENMTE